MSGPRYIDMSPEARPVTSGDWIWTDAGSRCIVNESHIITARHRHESCGDCPPNVVRYGLKCERLPKHTPIPPDVRAIHFHSHRSGFQR